MTRVGLRAATAAGGLLLAACAHMEPPPGGPVDTKKPFITAVQPAPDSTRVGLDLDARIKFSEWVAQDIERGKVFLVPPLSKRIRPRLSGNELRVTSTGRLDTNTTYVLGVLETVKDLNGLPLEAPLQLAFSTGPSLDSGSLAGVVVPFQGRPSLGAFAALYPRGPELRGRFQHLTHRNDSVVVPAPQPEPRKEKPAYIVPADSLGRFAFAHVRPGRYALLGFQDVNGDLAPEVGGEALAIGPSVDIAKSGHGGASAGSGSATGGSASGDAQTLTLAPYDTVPLRLTAARWVQEGMYQGKCLGTVRLKLSRSPHPLAALRRDAYDLHKAGPDGKPAGASLPILDVCLNPLSGEIEIATPPLDRDSQYLASCAGLRDPNGNLADTSHNRAAFKADTAARDTAKAEPVFLGPRKVSGEVPRLPPNGLTPGAVLTAYFPRLLTDSLQAWLRAHLQAKLDTAPLAYTLERISHHEFSLKFPPLTLKGQRLVLALKSDSVATPLMGSAPGPGTSAPAAPAPGTTATGARPPSAPATATPATVRSDSAARAATPAATPWAGFVLADAAKMGALKFKQDRSAYGSRLVVRALASPFEVSRITPSADEVSVDSLPEGFYAVDYFRDTNGDAVWESGNLSPWTLGEPYVQWADSVEVKAGIAGRGDGRPPGTRRAAQTDSTKTEGAIPIPERKLAWPPAW